MEISSSFVQSFRRIEYQMGINIFRSLFHLFLISLFFLLGFRLGGAVYGFLLASVSAAGLGFYLVWKILLRAYPAIHPIYEVKKLLKISIPLLFVHISYFFALRTDSIMLGMFCTPKDVGIYTAASNVALQVYVISGALIAIFMPIISDVYNKKQVDDVKKLYNLVTRWSSIMTIFVVLFIITYAQSIMSIFGTSLDQQGHFCG
jgi:O-antigen/teichoic acid export membrane protein